MGLYNNFGRLIMIYYDYNPYDIWLNTFKLQLLNVYTFCIHLTSIIIPMIFDIWLNVYKILQSHYPCIMFKIFILTFYFYIFFKKKSEQWVFLSKKLLESTCLDLTKVWIRSARTPLFQTPLVRLSGRVTLWPGGSSKTPSSKNYIIYYQKQHV